jgi:hypothetical protein
MDNNVLGRGIGERSADRVCRVQQRFNVVQINKCSGPSELMRQTAQNAVLGGQVGPGPATNKLGQGSTVVQPQLNVRGREMAKLIYGNQCTVQLRRLLGIYPYRCLAERWPSI